MVWFFIGLLALVVIAILWIIGIYNRLVGLRNQVKNGWSQIDVQLQRRYDLIPNLVETVKGYMNFERGTLEAVIQARNQAATARSTMEQKGGPTGEGSMKDLLGAESNLQGAMTRFFALAENYPQLKASENMRQLQKKLSSRKIKWPLQDRPIIDQVMLYNTSQQRISQCITCSSFWSPSGRLL